MSLGSHCSDPKRIKLDLNDAIESGTSAITSNQSNFDDLLNSPSDTCENTSIISAFDHDSSSILSGSVYESSCEVLLSDISTKGILKSPDSCARSHSLTTRNRIKFHEIEIFYFNRQQSFCSIPSLGGSALGMEMQHFLSEKLKFDSDFDTCVTKKKYDSNAYDRTTKCLKEDYSILQPIVAKHRRVLLKNSGTSRIESVDKEVCDLIRSSRERCGCQCVAGQCLPDTCTCALNGIQCQVDRGNFPCCCGPNPCANPLGRVEFNPIRVRTHFIHTIMRLQMQDQYQSEEPKVDTRRTESDGCDSRAAKEFDINMCNSTDQGSCRDCQNDKYLHVLMNEWTLQLQKFHTSKHYPPNVPIPYNSWSYLPESFCSTTYCDKDTSAFPILPYSQYTVSTLPALNFGIGQINYHGNVPDLQYSLYSNSCADGHFGAKSSGSHFSVSDEDTKSISLTKQQVQEITTSKSNSDIQSTKIHNQMTSYTYPIFPTEKSPIYTRYPYEKSSTFVCKYNNPALSAVQSDLKEMGYTASAYVNTIPFSPNKPIQSPPLSNHVHDPEPSTPSDLSSLSSSSSSSSSLLSHDKITHASNGQLYTVLQPVSESGIVSTFYQNSQACDWCKICKYKCPTDGPTTTTTTNRQRTDHLCVPDYTLTTALYNSNNTSPNLQIPIECPDKSEVCA